MPVQFPKATKLTLHITLRAGRKEVTRKITVRFPKDLYPFELKREAAGFVIGFKNMVAAMQRTHREMNKFSRGLFRTKRIKRAR